MKTVQGRSFGDAGRAPTGPEIEDDDSSAQVRQMAWLTSQVESEILRGCSGDGSFALTIAGYGEDDDQA